MDYGYYYDRDNLDSRPSTTNSSSAGQDIIFIDNNDRSYDYSTPPKDPTFMFTAQELEPERAATKAEATRKTQLFVDSERESRRALKEKREKAYLDRENVRKQRAKLEKSQARVMKRRSDVLEDMRFSRANVVSYDIPGVRPYKCCGTFYVQPFAVIAPPKRITRTEQLWRDAGLLPQLPGQPGGFVTKEVKEAEKRKLEIQSLLNVPIRTHQPIPKQEPWERSVGTKKSSVQYPSNITYPSGTISFQAPRFDVPDEPAVTVDGRNLKRSNQFSKSGRILLSGDLPIEPAPIKLCAPRKLHVQAPPPKIDVPPTLSTTAPAPQIDVRYHDTIVRNNVSMSSSSSSVGQVDKQWELIPYLPTSADPHIGYRGDGTVIFEALSSTPKSATNHDTTERHAQTKSEIAEAIEKYVFNFQLYFILKKIMITLSLALIVSNNIEFSISL
jgi:hypothetical protein